MPQRILTARTGVETNAARRHGDENGAKEEGEGRGGSVAVLTERVGLFVGVAGGVGGYPTWWTEVRSGFRGWEEEERMKGRRAR